MALSLMSSDNLIEVKEYLEEQYHRYCTSSFIDDDPIQIPHLFDSQQIPLLGDSEKQLLQSRRSLLRGWIIIPTSLFAALPRPI